jgi:hypothetical protein
MHEAAIEVIRIKIGCGTDKVGSVGKGNNQRILNFCFIEFASKHWLGTDLVCPLTYPRGRFLVVPSNNTLSTNQLTLATPPPASASPRTLSKRRDSFSFSLLMTLSFGALGILSLRKSIAQWSDIMHGKGEIRSLFFALLVFLVVLVLGESFFRWNTARYPSARRHNPFIKTSC